MATNNIPFGTIYLNTTTDSSDRNILNVVFTTRFSASNTKWHLGNVPFDLGYANGYYMPLFWMDTTGTYSNWGEFYWTGQKMLYAYNTETENSVLPINVISSANNYAVSETIIKGVPLGVTSDGYLLAGRITGNLDTSARCFIGGVPLRAGLIGSRWFLIGQAL